MTDDAEERIIAKLDSLETKVVSCEAQVAELRVVLVGDQIKDRAGILPILESQRREIYGNKDTQEVGIKARLQRLDERVASLETDRLKIFAIATALSFLAGVGWTVIRHFVFR